jgi:hypothetical protein
MYMSYLRGSLLAIILGSYVIEVLPSDVGV